MNQDNTAFTIKINSITIDESLENTCIIPVLSNEPGVLTYDVCFNPTYLLSYVESGAAQL